MKERSSPIVVAPRMRLFFIFFFGGFFWGCSIYNGALRLGLGLGLGLDWDH